jgi:hypothetical protein
MVAAALELRNGLLPSGQLALLVAVLTVRARADVQRNACCDGPGSCTRESTSPLDKVDEKVTDDFGIEKSSSVTRRSRDISIKFPHSLVLPKSSLDSDLTDARPHMQVSAMAHDWMTHTISRFRDTKLAPDMQTR